jgi:hypothetical protein
MSDGGKGSAPRKQRDDEAYMKNWENIFRKGNHGKAETSQTDSTETAPRESSTDSSETQ